jgi:RNA polymerase sigma factor for flagellar operon FliA
MTRLILGRDRFPAASPQLLDLAEALAASLRARNVPPSSGPSATPRPDKKSMPGQDTPPSAPGVDAPPGDEAPSSDDVPTGDAPCPSEEPAAALWTAYRTTPGRPTRDRLVLHYCALVRAVVHRTAVRLPPHVDVADLVQSGVFGLVEAIERYDPERCPRFESYAASRIRGAVLDELRAQDWVPRTVRLRARQTAHARDHLAVRLRRTATEREVADLLKVGSRDLGATVPSRLVSIEQLQEHAHGGGTLDVLVDDAPDAAAAVQERETRRQLWQAVAELGERDRQVVHLYYLEQRTLAEIGRMLGVTESRVCQLHSRLVGRLRGALEELAAG